MAPTNVLTYIGARSNEKKTSTSINFCIRKSWHPSRLICPSSSRSLFPRFTIKTRGPPVNDEWERCCCCRPAGRSTPVVINISSGPSIENMTFWTMESGFQHLKARRYEMNKLFGVIQGIRLCLSRVVFVEEGP